jgi:hypothetical protein
MPLTEGGKLVTLAPRTAQMRVGFVRARPVESLNLRVPIQRLAAYVTKDRDQLAHHRGAVSDRDIRRRQLARTDTFGEVADMRRALARPFFCGVWSALTQFGPVRLEVASQDLDLAVGALKNRAELLMIVDDGLLERNFGTVCVDQLHFALLAEDELHRSR